MVERMMGTVTVTAVGTYGQGIGWGIPNAESTFTVTVGDMPQSRAWWRTVSSRVR